MRETMAYRRLKLQSWQIKKCPRRERRERGARILKDLLQALKKEAGQCDRQC